MFVPLSVLEFRDRAALFFGDKIGVIDGEAQFTYREFATRTHRLANALVELGRREPATASRSSPSTPTTCSRRTTA